MTIIRKESAVVADADIDKNETEDNFEFTI